MKLRKIYMPISKRLRDLKEPLDIDLQLMAAEMDTSVNRIKYLSNQIMSDAISLECFNNLIRDIESGEGIEVTSFNDNTVLYEYLDEAVVVYTFLTDKYILFDSMITAKIENRLDSYNNLKEK